MKKPDNNHLKINIYSINIGNYDATRSTFVLRNFGCWFDGKLTMITHITKVCAAPFSNHPSKQAIKKTLIT